MAKIVGRHTPQCSFCGKHQTQAGKLIAGPGVYICNECIDLCNDIIEEERLESVGEADPPAPGRRRSVAAGPADVADELRTVQAEFDRLARRLAVLADRAGAAEEGNPT